MEEIDYSAISVLPEIYLGANRNDMAQTPAQGITLRA